jgi:hypothetical protein
LISKNLYHKCIYCKSCEIIGTKIFFRPFLPLGRRKGFRWLEVVLQKTPLNCTCASPGCFCKCSGNHNIHQLTSEQVFDKVPDEVKDEILFNLDIFLPFQ